MDPDAALREIREIMALIRQHRRMTNDQLEHLAELIDGLDNWLTSGGFLPAAWGQELRNDQRELAIRRQERRERGEQ